MLRSKKVAFSGCNLLPHSILMLINGWIKIQSGEMLKGVVHFASIFLKIFISKSMLNETKD